MEPLLSGGQAVVFVGGWLILLCGCYYWWMCVVVAGQVIEFVVQRVRGYFSVTVIFRNTPILG